MPTTPTLVIWLLTIFGSSIPGLSNARPPGSTPQLPDSPGNMSPRTTSDVSPRTWKLYIEDPYVRDVAQRIVEGAEEWLSFPNCQRLFSEFVDQGGRYLTVKLTELGVSPGEYLRWIIFEDGTDRRRCRQAGVVAFTTPGSRVVYLCGRDFMRGAQRAPDEARAAIVHEMLHSLGLGENPPSSKEISHRVKHQCWK